jgi:hypothetical protein
MISGTPISHSRNPKINIGREFGNTVTYYEYILHSHD